MALLDKTIHVNMLGTFSLVYGGEVVDDKCSRSKRVWTLIQYLIANRRKEISQNELIEAIWGEEEIGDPANSLKTIAHRARAILDKLNFVSGKDMIVFRNGCYEWNNDIATAVDAEEFEALIRAGHAEQDHTAKLNLLFEAQELYKGDFLPKSAMDDWVMPLNSYYRTQYGSLVHELTAGLSSVGRFDDTIIVCRRAIIIDPYDEAVHLSLIQSLVETGAQQEAMQHYTYVTELFYTHFGVTPSEELTSLYKDIVRTSKSTEMNLGVIRDGLAERERESGAFYCEYEFFKDIYRLNARSASRNGQIVHIALLTVMDAKGKRLTQERMNAAMDRLKDVVRTSLRRGDVFARYSVSQYLIMLPSASFENAEMVMNRVTRSFKHAYPKMETLLHFSVLPLDPVM